MSSTLPPLPEKESDLGFERKPMVKWMSPAELVRAGVKALLSTLFGAYADWREVQALRADISSRKMVGSEMTDEVMSSSGVALSEVYDMSDHAEAWFDYVSDLGDGFNATYTVARAIAEEELTFGEHHTRRGDVLVMGGDQVYPTATREEYNNRLHGPYRSALPYVLPEEKAPALFAVPGNHDWYDGLTSFMRLFCQGRWIGGWKTYQKRSYFAIRLPGNWWIWGIDVQLASDIDLPQLEYFRSIAKESEPSNIILCNAEPTWVFTVDRGEDAYKNLEYFEKHVITEYGHTLKIGLAGDLHTYARYQMDGTGKQRFIAGGGGAYLYPSHQMPASFTTPAYDWQKHETVREEYNLQKDPEKDRKSLFPPRLESRKIALGALKFPMINVGFSLLLSLIYLLLAWQLQAGSKYIGHDHNAGEVQENTMMDVFSSTTSMTVVEGYMFTLIPGSIATVMLALVMLGAFVAFADHKNLLVKIALGTAHTVLHLLQIGLLIWIFSQLNIRFLGLSIESVPQVVLFGIEMLVAGGFMAGLLVGVYLFLSNQLIPKHNMKMGVHANEVFACQPNPHFKHFLRMHIDKSGDLTIYPVGIRKIHTHWKFRKPTRKTEPLYEGTKAVKDMVCLIEKPIFIKNDKRVTDEEPLSDDNDKIKEVKL